MKRIQQCTQVLHGLKTCILKSKKWKLIFIMAGIQVGFAHIAMGQLDNHFHTIQYHQGRANLSIGDRSTFIGFQAGGLSIDNIGSDNTFIGNKSGYINTSGYDNTFLGSKSGLNNTTGNYNTFLGVRSGQSNSTGVSNTFIGTNAGTGNTTGHNNAFLGTNAGSGSTTGDHNTYLGGEAGRSNDIGNENTFLGYGAGYVNAGEGNTYLGTLSGRDSDGSNNVFIGYHAGYSEDGSDKLYIDNSGTNSPLIYGEFNNDFVNINGKLGVGISSPVFTLDIEGDDNSDWVTQFKNSQHNTGIHLGGRNDIGTIGTIGTTAMVLNPDGGNVGIGIDNPKQKLHVNGDYYGRGHIYLYAATGDGQDGVAYLQARDDSNTSSIALQLRTQNAGSLINALTITPDGWVGIGETSPSAKLHVNGNGYFSSDVGIGTGNNAPVGRVHIVSTSQSPAGAILTLGPTDASNLRLGYDSDYTWIQSHNGSPLHINKIGNNTILNSDSGNVGIGIDNPQSKLAVNGKITTKEVEVTPEGWADFVFEETYALPTLEEVEAHITTHKHLPGVPSAQEVLDNGIELGVMNATLLQKIEELTLYMIDLKKKNDMLEAKVNELESGK